MIYRIKDWNKHFEKADSRRVISPQWVPMPVRQDGSGFRKVAGHDRAPELFAAWVLIVEVAAKMPVRGTLEKDGQAVTPKCLALRTGFPQTIFELAFRELVKPAIGWLEIIHPGTLPADYQRATSPSGLQDRT